LPEHKGEKQGRGLKIILVKAMDFMAEWQINADERANAGLKKACLLAGCGIVSIFAYYV
jgi:hypothetical protein